MSLGSRLAAWLDERTGYRALVRNVLLEPVRGGARMSYVFGSVLVFLFLLQALTGIALATVYAPSIKDAWAAVAYLDRQVPLGWLARGLHSMGASALVVVVVLHLLQVVLYGAYRRPREVNFYLGLLLMLGLFAFALTGYLLPWDQKGYWATQVTTSLVGAMPLLGPALRNLLQGGPVYGQLTLSRFYALHTLVLPAVMTLLTVLHVGLMRKHGITPSPSASEAELDQKTVPFWPAQLTRDLLAMAVVLGILFALVVKRHGVGLEAPADPASAYDARPEWYFLPLYELLKFFPGRFELVAALGAPLAAFGVLAALPLLDRGPSRAPRDRKRYLGATLLVLGGTTGLGLLALRADRNNLAYQVFRKSEELKSARALALAEKGVPPSGGLSVYENDPLFRGRSLFQERCAGCHQLSGVGERRAPDLDGWSSRSWLRAFLKNPDGARFFGSTKIRGMKPVQAEGADLDALVEWIYAEGRDCPKGTHDCSDRVDESQVARGKRLFEKSGCDDCHETDGEHGGDGTPNLGGRAQHAWIRALLENPAADRFFDGKNQMPKFRDKLDDRDLDALSALLANERLQ